MLASFIEPIMLNGAFQGIVGADLSVNFIQDMLLAPTRSSTAAVKWPDLGNGRLVAYTKDPASSAKRSATFSTARDRQHGQSQAAKSPIRRQGTRADRAVPALRHRPDRRALDPDAATAAGRGDGRSAKLQADLKPNANPTPSAWPWSAC
jgi:hypothetical protein